MFNEFPTPDKLAEWEALAARASRGPWRLPYEDGAICRPYDALDAEMDDGDPNDTDDVSLCGLDNDGMAIVFRRSDAEFIAAARTAVPRLIAEVRRLRRLRALEAALVGPAEAVREARERRANNREPIREFAARSAVAAAESALADAVLAVVGREVSGG